LYPPHVRIKMCGMTRREDVEEAVTLGVDALGFIFYSGSRRAISLDKAKSLSKDLPPFVGLVAVLVNPSAEQVGQIIQELPIGYLQFHGQETPEFCAQFHKPYIKSIAMDKTDTLNEAMLNHAEAAAILVDTPDATDFGGTGRVFDWQHIPSVRKKPMILAGGLTPLNVVAAIAATRPFAVDVCSGIEASYGIKDKAKMRAFVNAIQCGV